MATGSLLAQEVWLSHEGPLSLSPYEVGFYAVGYARGWTAAKQRGRIDPIVLEAYGLGRHTPGAPRFADEVRERLRIEIEGIAGCGVSSYIHGHAKGYNTAALAEIKRRYGSALVIAAEKEDERLAQLAADRLIMPESALPHETRERPERD